MQEKSCPLPCKAVGEIVSTVEELGNVDQAVRFMGRTSLSSGLKGDKVIEVLFACPMMAVNMGGKGL